MLKNNYGIIWEFFPNIGRGVSTPFYPKNNPKITQLTQGFLMQILGILILIMTTTMMTNFDCRRATSRSGENPTGCLGTLTKLCSKMQGREHPSPVSIWMRAVIMIWLGSKFKTVDWNGIWCAGNLKLQLNGMLNVYFRWNWFTARNYCRKRCMDLVRVTSFHSYNAAGGDSLVGLLASFTK